MDQLGGLSDLTSALVSALRRETGRSEIDFAQPPVALRGGNSARLLQFALTGAPPSLSGELVARFPADAAAAANEAAIQSAIAAVGFPAPRVRRFTATSAGPCIVMEFVAGETPIRTAGPFGVARLFRELPARLASLMTELHALPVPALAGPGHGVDALLADVDDDRALTWLRTHRPDDAPVVVCHGDLHGENVLVVEDQVVALVDWELAGVARAELDVARTALVLELLPGISRAARRLLRGPATRSAQRFVAAYTAARPIDRNALQWCDALHAARLLAVTQREGRVAEVWRPLRVALTERLVRTTATK